jgi:hypothetical protein
MANLPFAKYEAPCDGKRNSLCNQLKGQWNGIVQMYNSIVSRPNLLAFHDPADTIEYIAGLYASIGRLEGMLAVLPLVPVKSLEVQELEAYIRANLNPISELSRDWYGRLQQEANKQTETGEWEILVPSEPDEYTLSALAFPGPQEFPEEPEEE